MSIIAPARQTGRVVLSHLPARWARWAPEVVLGVGLAGAGAVLAAFTRGLWFHGDDWDYLLTRGTVPGEDKGLWAPHGDHWSTAVVLVNRALFSLFGLRDYTPWALLTIALHLSVCIVLFAVLRQVGTRPWVAVATSWVVAFHGAAAEAMLWDAAMNQTGAVLFGLAALLCLERWGPGRLGLGLAWLCLTVALMFSGTGLTMVVLVVLFVLLDRGPRAGALVALPPIVLFGYWYASIGFRGAGSGLDGVAQYLQVPAYVWRGLSDAIEKATVLPGSGALLLVALLAAPFLPSRAPLRLRRLATAGVAAGLLQLTMIAVTRSGLGFEYAGSGRYAYLTLVFLAPAAAVLLVVVTGLVAMPRPVGVVVVAVLVGSYTLAGIEAERAYAEGARTVTGPWEERLLGIVTAVDDGERILARDAGTLLDDWIRPDLVVRPEIRRALPKRSGTAQGRLDAEGMFMVGVGRKGHGLFRPTSLSLVQGWTEHGRLSPRGCRTIEAAWSTPVLELDLPDGAELGVTGPATAVTTEVRRAGRSSGVRNWKVTPGSFFIASTAREAVLRVGFDAPGRYLVCTP